MEASVKRKKFSISSLTYKQQKILISITFLFVPVLLLILFTYVPSIFMFGYSFTDWDGISPTKNFIGLSNYKLIFSSPDYFRPFIVSLYYIVAAFIQIALAVCISYLISFRCRFANLFKGVYFFPSLINSVAISFIFIFFFRPGSTLDTILKLLGLGKYIQLWLQNPHLINVSLAFVSVWRYIGYDIVMFSAAMQSIPTDIIEAAEVDGANRFQQFIHIIIPGISTILKLLVFLSITGSLAAFEIPYIMTGGGNGSMTFVIQTVNFAFQNYRVGLASALAVILLIISILVFVIQRIVLQSRGA
ncbi:MULTISPECIES: carbohydrate ABC transporter permease [Thermoanaerobacterium]|jgi:multiple sugar transport system permease protein|uniref:Multiple sugar transport system permease protein n=1 Tax=Thermoanaerobacterium butyriciformans TaxID=1702242 RepID=A0ABS4NGS1_9THEO|nr:sugar ABC transporter permease [Thermoanaerobacterium butyriciformans]MBP2072203.1 multiple sugar transport system permease protein [Thermoanaerobacterium butyriciformans]WHE07306.1 sugar ABC transporter permease [Thermoanaerobacterium thermosaccharolyticum]